MQSKLAKPRRGRGQRHKEKSDTSSAYDHLQLESEENQHSGKITPDRQSMLTPG